MKQLMVKVRDRAKNVERVITRAAYAAQGPKVYDKLGFVETDENGNLIEASASPNPNPQVQERKSVRVVGPVAAESNPENAIPAVIELPIKEAQPESFQKSQPEQTQAAEKAKRKYTRKSISSPSDEAGK